MRVSFPAGSPGPYVPGDPAIAQAILASRELDLTNGQVYALTRMYAQHTGVAIAAMERLAARTPPYAG